MTLISRLEQAEAGKLAAENIALRSILGGGCDANGEGPHNIVVSGKHQFCSACGEDAKNGKVKPWVSEDRIARRIASLKAAGYE
jgi:hypothetical protein